MSSPGQSPHEPRDAADWFVRLRADDCSEGDWLAFADWLAADPSREAAYAEVEAVWVDFDDTHEYANQAPAGNVVPFKPRRGTVWRVAAMAGGLAAIAAVALVFIAPSTLTNPAVDYSAPAGQTRTVALADGSTIVLNRGSRLSVHLTARERTVRLIDGEAAFDVNHQPCRPFHIAAGDSRIDVIGTKFDVLSHDGGLTVTVSRGLVSVSPRAQAGGAPILLAAGKQLRQRGQGAAPAVTTVDPAAAFAWEDGRVIYRDERLADVAADLSRYVAKPIRVEASIADLRVTGALAIDNETSMVRRLETFLPIRGEFLPDEIRLKPVRRQP